jgi:hypothetical protein
VASGATGGRAKACNSELANGAFACRYMKIAIPRKGRPGPTRRSVESSRGFRILIKWRTGSEGRISHLKRSSASIARSSTASAVRRRGAAGECPLTTPPRSPLLTRRRTTRLQFAKGDRPQNLPTPGRLPVDHRCLAALHRRRRGDSVQNSTPCGPDRPMAMGTLTWTPARLVPRESSERVPLPLERLVAGVLQLERG